MRFLPSGRSRLCLQISLLAIMVHPAQAVILLTGDNAANQTAPDAARTDIFNAVGQVVNGAGVGGFGSAVAIRGKYVLTANHVSVTTGSHITFDGVALYERDTAFAPVKIGVADLKLIKLLEDPGLNEVKLFDAAQGDVPYDEGEPPETIFTTATIVGVGRGRDPGDNDGNTVWDWASSSTMAKRWGTNRIEGSVLVGYQSQDYEALVTTLEASSGNDEAAVVSFDSGCGMFVEHAGEWKLAGIATAVETGGSSTFDDADGDQNYFVRITSYAAAVEAAIPDLTTYAGWKVDHSLYGGNGNDDADGDGDGIPLLLEYALGGLPDEMSQDVLPVQQLTEDGPSTYLELVVTRPIGLQNISYVPQTTTDLANWPLDSAGILDDSPTAVDNGDGTETLVYRRAAAVTAQDHAFIRLQVVAN